MHFQLRCSILSRVSPSRLTVPTIFTTLVNHTALQWSNVHLSKPTEHHRVLDTSCLYLIPHHVIVHRATSVTNRLSARLLLSPKVTPPYPLRTRRHTSPPRPPSFKNTLQAIFHLHFLDTPQFAQHRFLTPPYQLAQLSCARRMSLWCLHVWTTLASLRRARPCLCASTTIRTHEAQNFSN